MTKKEDKSVSDIEGIFFRVDAARDAKGAWQQKYFEKHPLMARGSHSPRCDAPPLYEKQMSLGNILCRKYLSPVRLPAGSRKQQSPRLQKSYRIYATKATTPSGPTHNPEKALPRGRSGGRSGFGGLGGGQLLQSYPDQFAGLPTVIGALMSGCQSLHDLSHIPGT